MKLDIFQIYDDMVKEEKKKALEAVQGSTPPSAPGKQLDPEPKLPDPSPEPKLPDPEPEPKLPDPTPE